MPRIRFIEYDNRQWKLTELASRHNLAAGTFSARLNRLGETATGIARALATGIMTREQAGKKSARHRPWCEYK